MDFEACPRHLVSYLSKNEWRIIQRNKLYTQCRGCGEVFVIEVDHLTHARGQVRCNLCGTVFDGLETLSAEKPHEDEDLLLHDFDNAPPLLTQAYQSPAVAAMMAVEDDHEPAEPMTAEIDEVTLDSLDLAADSDATIPDQVGMDATQEDHFETAVPAFISEHDAPDDVPFVAEKSQQKQQPNSPQWMWVGLSVTMLVGLFWQAQQALASGLVTLPDHAISDRLCDWLSCVEAAEAVDLNAISLVSRKIRPHPGMDDALIITASMINANKLNKKFPALEIKLSDLNGQIVAMRRFVAGEYVPADVLRAGFVDNTLIPINLEIASPGDNAVAFEIGFVQP